MILEAVTKEMPLVIDKRIDVFEFQENPLLNPGALLISIKNKDGTQLRAALAESGKLGKSWGRDIRKDPKSEKGALAIIDCTPGRESHTVVNEELFGPRGVTVDGDQIFVATTEGIAVLDRDFKRVQTFADPFCNWMHALTTAQVAGTEALIASSSKLGTILMFDKNTGKIIERWHGWENGFDESLDGTIVTADAGRAAALQAAGRQVVLIDKAHPEDSLDVLTTPRQAFRSTGLTVQGNNVITSLFAGEIVELQDFLSNPAAAVPQVITSGHTNLHTPEYATVLGERSLWAADTMQGRMISIGERGQVRAEIDFSGQLNANLAAESRNEKIWLQGFKIVNGLIVALDGTCNKLIVADPESQTKRLIALPDQKWAVHDVLSYVA